MARCIKRSKEGYHRFIVLQIQGLARIAQHHQREEHKCRTKQEIAQIAMLLLVDEQHTNQERGIDHIGKVDIIAQ